MNFSKYQALSFDCYGTLVDWETGILTQLRAWANRQCLQVTDTRLIELFGAHERQVQADTPERLYPDILAVVHHRIAADLDAESAEHDATTFGSSVGDWPVFADTVEALQALSRSFKLFVLSNVDRASFQRSNAQMNILFDGIVTAQDVGAYKPDSRNFSALKQCVANEGIAPEALLHVGESIYHDVIPGTAAGLDTVWIDRQLENPEVPRASGALNLSVKPTMTFGSMAEFARVCGTGAMG